MSGQHALRLGVVGVVAGGAYPPFPSAREGAARRVRWAMEAPVEHRRPGEAPQRHASDKLVLLLLAMYADEDGKAWPAVVRLAREGNLSRATTKRAIHRLAASGWVTRRERVAATTIYAPKSPADTHCWRCWYTLPRGHPVCPVCGAEEPRELPLGEVHGEPGGGFVVNPYILRRF